jgi:hypothetical protein
VNAQSVIDHATVLRGERTHPLHGGREPLLGLGPHEEHVAMLCAEFLRRWRDSAEVKQRAAIVLVGFGRLAAGQVEIIKTPAPLDRSVGGPEFLQDLDNFAAAPVAVLVGLFQAR